jgi:hypothetical protein
MSGNSGCAVGQDGKLLDAKDIKWYEDADSSEPINTIPPPSESSESIPIHPFFHSGLDPSVVATGSRRSGRVTRPSNRITDPDNAEASSFATAHKLSTANARIISTDNAESTTHKRKASCSMAAGNAASRRVKVVVDDDESTDGGEISDYDPDILDHPATSDIEAGDTEPDEDREIAYMSTKAMGDADREVSLFLSL